MRGEYAPCGFDQTFPKFDAWCESMRGQTPIGVIPKSQLPNPKITTDDGGELLVSPEHRVYGTIVDQTNPSSSSSFNSGVDTTGTLFSTISLNSGSLDQILTSMPDDLYFKANAVYGKSSGGEIFLASSRNSEYSSLGTGSIFLNHKCLLATALLTSLPSSLACSSVNSLSFRISLAIENCISSKNSDITLSTYINNFSSTSTSTSCEDASQTGIMYPASCIQQTPTA